MKLKSIWILLLCAALLLTGCGSSVSISGIQEDETQPVDEATEPTVNPFWNVEVVTDEEEFPYDYTMKTFFEMDQCWEYAPLAVCYGINEDGSRWDLPAEDGFHVTQGSCSDGTYGYFFLNKGGQNVDGVLQDLSYLYKVDLRTWEIVKRSDVLQAQHANGCCYNPKTNRVYSANMSPNGKTVSVIDPETLTIVDQVTVYKDISAISYCEVRNQYVVRLTGIQGYDLAILDENFNLIKEFPGVNSVIGIQGLACDEQYIYRLDSGCVKRPGTEGVIVYDWDGNYVGVFRVVIDVGGQIQREVDETEALFIHNGEFYLSFNNGNGGQFYYLDMDLDNLIW